MNIQRFTGATAREALGKARMAFGEGGRQRGVLRLDLGEGPLRLGSLTLNLGDGFVERHASRLGGRVPACKASSPKRSFRSGFHARSGGV